MQAEDDPVACVARWRHGGGVDVILTAHRSGLGAAARVFADSSRHGGGAGIQSDGVWREWWGQGAKIRLTVGHRDGVVVMVEPGDVVAWTMQRFTEDDLASLAALRDQWLEALLRPSDALKHRETYQPTTLTDDERQTLEQARQDRRTAEHAMDALIDACLARDEPAEQAGEQLELFGATA